MMAKSFDLLIEFLLDEIAICGEQGESKRHPSLCLSRTISLAIFLLAIILLPGCNKNKIDSLCCFHFAFCNSGEQDSTNALL
jgi:hypothetical protein